MQMPEFLKMLAACEGTVTVSQGVVTFADGQSFDVANALPETAVEFADWRIEDGAEIDVPASLAGLGKVVLKQGGYGAQLDAVTPDGREFAMNMEFDAGALKVMVYPPDSETGRVTDDVPVMSFVVVNDGVIVSSNYGKDADLYQAEGNVSCCPQYDGSAILAALDA